MSRVIESICDSLRGDSHRDAGQNECERTPTHACHPNSAARVSPVKARFAMKPCADDMSSRAP